MNGPKQYRKRPVIIAALRLESATWAEMCEFVGVGPGADQPHGCWLDSEGKPHDTLPKDTLRIGLIIPTLEGEMLAAEGDWIIRGVAGEFYPCKPGIFAATYEAVEGQHSAHGAERGER